MTSFLRIRPGGPLLLSGGLPVYARSLLPAWPGRPNTNWRLPITAARVTTDGAWYDAQVSPATLAARLVASATDKTWPLVTIQSTETETEHVDTGGGSRDIALCISAVGPAGAMLCYVPDLCRDWTITVFQSFDSIDGSAGSGTWTVVPHTAWYPSDLAVEDSSHKNRRTQLVRIAPGRARWVRMHCVNGGTGGPPDYAPSKIRLAVNLAVIDLGAAGGTDFRAIFGMSITVLNANPLILRKRCRQFADPDADPVFLNYGASGHTFATIRTGAMQPAIALAQALGIQHSAVMVDPGPNDCIHNGPWPTNPYVIGPSGPLSSPVAGDFRALLSTAMGTGAPVFCANIGYANFDGSGLPDPTGELPPGQPSPPVGDLLWPQFGTMPYNDAIVGPLIRSTLPWSWDSATDAPRLDEYFAFIRQPPNWFFYQPSGVHVRDVGQDIEQALWDDWHRWMQRGSFAGSLGVARQTIADAAAGGPPYYLARLAAAVAQMGASSSPNARVNRGEMADTIGHAPVIYASPIAAMPGNPAAWWDCSDWTRMDDLPNTATGLITGQAGQVTDKIAGRKLVQPAKNVADPTKDNRPVFIPNVRGPHGMLRAFENEWLACTDSAIVGAIGAGWSATFVFRWGLAVSSFERIFAFETPGSNPVLLLTTKARPTGPSFEDTDPDGFITTAALYLKGPNIGESAGLFTPYTPYVMTIGWTGTDAIIRRNGAETARKTWSPASWAVSQMTVLGGDSWSSTVDLGDLVVCTHFNAADIAAIEAALLRKWGLA